MAEGAGALVLESLEHAKARGAKILGVIEGCGEMADSFHRTRSSPDGKPIIGCIRNAIADAGLTPDDIDYINPHGTGTPENDKMESLGVSAVFGERAEPHSDLVQQIDDRTYAVGRRRGRGGVHADDARAPAHPADHQLSRCRTRPSRSTWCRIRRATPRCATRSRTRSGSAARTSRWSWPASRLDRRANRYTIRMRALTLVADRKLELRDAPPPPPPGAGEVQIRVKAVALNHIDVWGWRGMAFAKRKTAAGRRRGSRRRDRGGRRRTSPRSRPAIRW